MPINLQKGQKISLEKEAPGLNSAMLGLGWDINKKKNSGGFFSKLFSGSQESAFDLDSGCLMINSSGKLDTIVYYSNLRSPDGSVIHSGDNLTGEGDGDDEKILVDLKKVPEKISKLIFIVNIFQAKQRKQDFSMVENAFIRLVDSRGNNEVARFNLSKNEAGITAMTFAELNREGNEWKMTAIGKGSVAGSLQEMASAYE